MWVMNLDYDTLDPGRHIIIELKPTAFNMGEYVVTAQYSPQSADKSIYKVKLLVLNKLNKKELLTSLRFLPMNWEFD